MILKAKCRPAAVIPSRLSTQMTAATNHAPGPSATELSPPSRSKAFTEGRKFALGTLWRIIKMALHYRGRMAAAVLATIAASLFQLFIPRYVGAAVDNAHGLIGQTARQTELASEALWFAALMIVGLSIVRGLFSMLQNYLGESIGHLIGCELRLTFYDKIQRLSFSFHDRAHTGDLITRGMLDLEGVRMFISTGLLRLLMLAVLIGVGTVLLLSTNVWLGLLSLSFVPFVGWRSAAARLRLRFMWLVMQERLSILTRSMEENLTGIRVVRAFSAETHEIEKFDAASQNVLEVALRRVSVRVGNTTVMTFAFFVAMALVLWVGGLQVLGGETSVGTLAEVLTFMMILQMPVRQIGMMVNSFARASTCGNRLFEVLDLEPAIRDRPGAGPLETTEGRLRFDQVYFSFEDGEDRNALTDISFEVGPGQTLGIVGPSGSGKSTIANLIPRFYEVSDGTVSIDGRDIRDVTLDSLRSAVGVVQQNAYMFTASVDNNVAYGDPWASDERITRANRTAQLHDYVSRLPSGYGTLVGERGVSLSGGQRQRLSIARSILTDPAILVFDDSTAAIDAATEHRIRLALQERRSKSTTLIISHRLSSLMHSDEIIYLERGRIVERGTHDQLVALRGRYYDLFRLQVRPHDGANAQTKAADDPSSGDRP